MDKGANVARTVRLLRAMIGLVPLLWVPVSQGQTTSITSSGLNTQVSHVGGQPSYDITGGTRPGNGTNLFHSFGDFSVGTHDVARFMNDAHLPTTNILSRVTGGNPSNIFGEINTTNFPGANLYLINPAGVLFGATATLNVSGSAHVSTADYLRLADGLRFNAVPGPQDALLSQAPVVAFGFLTAHPRPITAQGSRLSVEEGKVLSLVGGEIKVTGGTLAASGGQINLVSLAGRGEARVAPEGITISKNTHRGHIVIKGGTQPDDVARIDTSGLEGGAVVIRGGKLSLARVEVTTEAAEANHTGGAIVIEATKSANLKDVVMRTSEPFPSPPINFGRGPVSLTAPSLSASNLTIDTRGPGDNISIRATGDVTLKNSSISTGSPELMGIDAGNITVQAAKLDLTESTIDSNAEGGGHIGNIAIDVGRLTMQGGRIRTSGFEHSAPGGNISVSARGAILIDGGSISTGNTGPQDGGSITLFTPHLTLNHVGRISTGSDGARAGDITVNVRTLNMFNGGSIMSDTIGASMGESTGNINIVASQSITMAGPAVLSDGHRQPTQILVNAPGAGSSLGRLHIMTPTMHLKDRAVVSAFNESTPPVTGSIDLEVGRLDISRGAGIESRGREVASPIAVAAAKSITLDHGTITTATDDPGQAGTVHLHAGKSIQLRNGSLVSADNAGEGDAGHIAIHAGKSVVIRDSLVSARAPRGNGGTIDVDAKHVTLRNSQLTTSVSGGPETVGGDIAVYAKNMTLRNSQILSTAAEGDGGTIHLRSRHTLHKDAKSVIDASSEFGTDGTVIIESGH